MFFVLSKTLGLLSVPSNIFILIGVVGAVLLLTRFARAGRRLLVISVVLIAVCGILPVGQALTLALEERFRNGMRRAVRRTAFSFWAAR